MDSRNSKSQDVEWTEPRQGQTGTPHPVEDEDEIMLRALGVCDGFRPNAVNSTTSFPDRNTVSSYFSGGDTIPSTPVDRNLTVSPLSRQSSISKPPIPDDPSAKGHALGNEGIHAFHNARPSYPISRQVSSATSISTTSSAFTDASPVIVREQSYQGPTGPSHPYTLYRQDIGLNRSLSVSTTSTVRPPPEQPFVRPIGPTHPYGLYAQNTVGIDQVVTVPGLAAGGIVGFPGIATDNYRRRLGPDGEEIGGLIGPHGHTEELPPYTRYPDEQYARKVRDAEALNSPSSLPPSNQPQVQQRQQDVQQRQQDVQQRQQDVQRRQQDHSVQAPAPIPGAGGIGIAARNPEFDSVEDLTSQHRHSSASYISTSNLSQHNLNTAAAAIVSEDEKPTKRWRTAGKRRICGGIPYWVAVLLLIALLVVGIIIGTVVGTFVARRGQERDNGITRAAPSPGTPPVYDASPTPTPKDLAELPEGRFAMPLVIRQQPNICFNDTTHAPAWSCSIIFGLGAGMFMDVKKESDKYSVSIGANETLTINNGLFAYGTQPQVIQGSHILQTANDLLEPSRGTAWYKMLPFNKTVIVPENALSATMPNSAARFRRALNPPVFGPNDFRRKLVAQPGDKPWICTWPETLLEIFIYPNQTSASTRIGGQLSSIAGATPTSPSLTRGAPFPFLTGTSVPTGSFSDFFGATDRFPLSTPAPTPSATSGDGEFGSVFPGYPRVVKLEERRVKRSPRPVCRQVSIESGGIAKPVIMNGRPVEITIQEQGNSPPLRKRGEEDEHLQPKSHQIVRRDPADISDCGCVWFIN
ncbi:hypothetical protein MCOR25_001999 [Pyricularia grisea]|uniref:DUF7820 domain-containing protein n=1 Tax=Pyricularia grisea TaxID=148305 RepID=A0A6P8AWJ6_PYRGI|nr:uncharacterized protein PgNI_08223 [Pyricularia grisea]KAI6379415.1 hypothetical protein MCOR25_001999 [Pyricularia grisea]TLD06549.1 hypothetical protein PgNI_08223 [Pyricularia grisea]